jgi:peptidyl-tRNA hydrolase
MDAEESAADPDAPIEMVLPLVVRVERDAPPERRDALEAAPIAVLSMLSESRPDWQDAIEQWDSYRIRKVVRRARGAEWRRALALDGLTIVRGSAEVRVYPPIPIDAWPKDLARLQVAGTELTDSYPPAPAPPGTPLILLAPDVTMSTGKAMAQAGHAAQLGWRTLSLTDRARWQRHGFELAVRDADPPQWQAAVRTGAPVVHDAGFTEVSPNSQTALIVL